MDIPQKHNCYSQYLHGNVNSDLWISFGEWLLPLLMSIKLQPAIFPLYKRVIRFHELPAETIQCFSQYGLYIIDSLNSIEHCLK